MAGATTVAWLEASVEPGTEARLRRLHVTEWPERGGGGACRRLGSKDCPQGGEIQMYSLPRYSFYSVAKSCFTVQGYQGLVFY